jgi:hypothetical protein
MTGGEHGGSGAILPFWGIDWGGICKIQIKLMSFNNDFFSVNLQN